MNRILSLLPQLPGHSLVSGGSHAGKLYRAYTDPRLSGLPAFRHDTKEFADFIEEHAGKVKDKVIYDYGCANGALTLELASRGAEAVGYDIEPVQLDIAKEASRVMEVDADFVEVQSPLLPNDITLFLSVWKWIVRNASLDEANATLKSLSSASTLLFDSGLTGTGTDLVPVSPDEIPRIIYDYTNYSFIKPLYWHDEALNITRTIWKCSGIKPTD